MENIKTKFMYLSKINFFLNEKNKKIIFKIDTPIHLTETLSIDPRVGKKIDKRRIKG